MPTGQLGRKRKKGRWLSVSFLPFHTMSMSMSSLAFGSLLGNGGVQPDPSSSLPRLPIRSARREPGTKTTPPDRQRDAAREPTSPWVRHVKCYRLLVAGAGSQERPSKPARPKSKAWDGSHACLSRKQQNKQNRPAIFSPDRDGGHANTSSDLGADALKSRSSQLMGAT